MKLKKIPENFCEYICMRIFTILETSTNEVQLSVISKVLKKVILTETFNVNFHNKFIKFWVILLFNFSTYILVYIYK